jgi:hypothetical protein
MALRSATALKDREQVVGVNGLLEVGHDIERETVWRGRNHDDGHGTECRIAGAFCQKHCPVHYGHHQVQDDHGHVPAAAKDSEGLVPVRRGDDVISFAFQESAERFSGGEIIVDY